MAATQGILGIRPEHDGLRVDPALPADWDGFSATRHFRGTTYRITVEKPVGVTGRVTSLDGRRRDDRGERHPAGDRAGQRGGSDRPHRGRLRNRAFRADERAWASLTIER